MNTRILAIGSCVHRNSLSQKILQIAKCMLPTNIQFDIANISALPLYNEDIPQDDPSYEPVNAFRHQIKRCNGIMFACSEFPLGYPYCITGPLQNAMDWAAAEPNLLVDKVAAFVGVEGEATSSSINCVALRQLCIILGMRCEDDHHFVLDNKLHFDRITGVLDLAGIRRPLMRVLEKLLEKSSVPAHLHFVHFIDPTLTFSSSTCGATYRKLPPEALVDDDD